MATGPREAHQMRSLLEAIPLAAVMIGVDERIIAANQAAQDLLGSALMGRHFITTLRQPAMLDTIEACLKDRAPRETRYLTNDGSNDITYVVSCTYVETDLGQGVLTTFEDITHLQEVAQMRRDFVANVSHELRSPLTALMGFIETLRGPARGDVDATERFLGIMQGEASRMERLVRDLLSLSRVESNQRARPVEKVDLVACIRSVLHTLRPVTEDADVTVALDAPEGPVTVPGDLDQLKQVLTNLIENALKYGGSGKTVYVTLTVSDNEAALRAPAAVIMVRDEGPGIDEVHIPRLTERFYRVDSHRSREMGGTGLGLAIVKHIINRHRGRLRIESTLGQGSAFRVILPRTHPG